jgi:hypothetical protein
MYRSYLISSAVSVLTYTTFYVGLLRNQQELLRDVSARILPSLD